MKTIVSSANSNTTTSGTATSAANPSVMTKPDIGNDSSMNLQFQAPSANTTTSLGGGGIKRPVSLDLNKSTQAKKLRQGPGPLILESPDLQNMKTLNTPDIEKILLSSLQTPQPGTVFPTKVGSVTSEQEAFSKGFEEVLHSLHNSKNSQSQLTSIAAPGNTAGSTSNATTANTTSTTSNSTSTGMSGGSFTYTNLESSFPVAIKDEPQNGPVSPPVSPIDMETQEKIKLERKRQRNRVAASKCRKRKLERISKLEDKVKILKGENTDLGSVVKTLKDHVAQLKQQVIEHMESGCSISTIYNGTALLHSK